MDFDPAFIADMLTLTQNGGTGHQRADVRRAGGGAGVGPHRRHCDPFFLLAPAIWNGYPLLQWDTGGYLARWYEGYLVPSRSTVFGLYLHIGEGSGFWFNLILQALATLWIIWLTLRVLGLAQPFRVAAISLLLILTTALPWLASMLLTDIFAGLSVLSLFLLVLHGDKRSRTENAALFVFTAFAAASHSATLGVLTGLCGLALLAWPWLRTRIALPALALGASALVTGAAMLLAANYALSGQFSWTPGGYGVAFGRMMQDGIVARYLREHCGEEQLKLCPYRDALPATADEFLWGHSVFNTLGRFEGMEGEMGYIVTQSLKPIRCGRPTRPLPQPGSNWSMSPPAKAPTAGYPTPTGSSSATSPQSSRPCARRISSTGTSTSPP